jgi:hypothetical protein
LIQVALGLAGGIQVAGKTGVADAQTAELPSSR